MILFKDIYNYISGKTKAEKNRIKQAELAERKVELEKWRDKFFELIKNGTNKYDVLSITYKYTDFSKKYWSDYARNTDWKLLVLCDNNTLKNAQDSYDNTEYWGYLNATNDDERLKNGFKIVFRPWIEDNKLTAKSFVQKGNYRQGADLIYLFDCDEIKLNDPNDIDEMIDILSGPRDFYGGNVESIINSLKFRK